MKKIVLVLTAGLIFSAMALAADDSGVIARWKNCVNKGLCQITAPCNFEDALIDPKDENDLTHSIVRMRQTVKTGLKLVTVFASGESCVYTFARQ